jgi:hypothetical protein
MNIKKLLIRINNKYIKKMKLIITIILLDQKNNYTKFKHIHFNMQIVKIYTIISNYIFYIYIIS